MAWARHGARTPPCAEFACKGKAVRSNATPRCKLDRCGLQGRAAWEMERCCGGLWTEWLGVDEMRGVIRAYARPGFA
ncbi:hypothetical protein AIOL_000604 [Candidatus Rhodobacter oscarellae]|uniref:Uncharacterized protein n=1 Tax=Candidatus Rhodobacter oscarellae TaxID=1675527 RepID=A0A0J9EFJ5_9RHOB|nr:hypothetical protein AIOL_000604 [Candidatus Rhodobacter lobularis]